MGIIVESSLHVLESIAGLNMEGKAGGGDGYSEVYHVSIPQVPDCNNFIFQNLSMKYQSNIQTV